MGLLAKLKSMFEKNIDCGKALDDVFFHIMPWIKVTIGSNLIVKDGFVALFVCKNKVTDILPAGKHKLDNSTIPNTFKRLKLYKINKYGNTPKKFNCDIYFVSTGIVRDFEFVSNNPYIKKSKRFGRVIAYSEGVCDFCIDKPQKLVEYILLERAYIKDKVAIRDISNIIGNAVNEIMEKSGEGFGTLIANVKNTNAIIEANIDKSLEFCGLKCNNFDLRLMRVNSRLQQKLDEYLKIQREYNTQFEQETSRLFADTLSSVAVEQSLEMRENDKLERSRTSGFQTEEVVQNKKQCAYCGKLINKQANFCEFCGFNQDNIK